MVSLSVNIKMFAIEIFFIWLPLVWLLVKKFASNILSFPLRWYHHICCEFPYLSESVHPTIRRIAQFNNWLEYNLPTEWVDSPICCWCKLSRWYLPLNPRCDYAFPFSKCWGMMIIKLFVYLMLVWSFAQGNWFIFLNLPEKQENVSLTLDCCKAAFISNENLVISLKGGEM